jgi:hypothetical protein
MTYVDNDRVGGWVDVPIEVNEAGRYSISIYQFLYPEYGVWKVTMKGPGLDQVLDPAMDFYDYSLSQTPNYPENFLYGTWHENKVGVYTLQPGAYIVRFECIGANPVARIQGKSYTYIGTRVLDLERAGQPGYNMALDGISLRKLPWGDTWSWMQDYLKQEETLFAERVASARAMVENLARAVERFKADVGEFPRTLEELVARPSRLTGKRGRWPYVEGGRIPLDPWGQSYRYRQPGVQNPGGFDVWSLHGNERNPKGWIGNWAERSDP